MVSTRSGKKSQARSGKTSLRKVPGKAKPKTPEDSVAMLAVLQQFRTVVRAIRAHYDRVETNSGVSGAQLWALARIAERPGIKVGVLARALAIHQSTASNMLDRLEKLGLIAKLRGDNDQRMVSIFATPRGEAALKSAPQPLIGVLQKALGELSATQLKGLHQHLQAVIQAMHVKGIAEARSTPLSDM